MYTTANKIYSNLDVFEGIVKKKKTAWTKFFGETNDRYFKIDFQTEKFGYAENEGDHISTEFTFDELIGVTGELTEEDICVCDWAYGFKVMTEKRDMVLYCEEEADKDAWIQNFNLILKEKRKKFWRVDLVYTYEFFGTGVIPKKKKEEVVE
ncbi:MAG: hypothetical protein MJ252_19120, partial [archaeon]|nr:hypothetical protein [archaeon]